MDVLKRIVAATALALAGPAAAHVSLQPPTATAGGYQVLRFGVGHGCDGKATTALRIEIPAGVATARPQPKPGWRLAVETAPGQPERVTAIVWSGDLPADQFDEFLILAKLPAASGPLAFPAVQTCGAAEVRWTEPVTPGAERPQRPAPTLVLTPAASAAGEHQH